MATTPGGREGCHRCGHVRVCARRNLSVTIQRAAGEQFYTDSARPPGQRFVVKIFLNRKTLSRPKFVSRRTSRKGLQMFTVDQYRAKAIEYSNLAMIAHSSDDLREYQRLERSFTELADNAQWLTDNHEKTILPAQSATQQ
jgi:hypothetical protein